ncbi:MAG TPA: hypothetical protein VKF84_17400 [Candidatus Sulfotelmatobacter sp.]|nr:hypothetical protein [Candidatus Sulfotelmatobacter sp.]
MWRRSLALVALLTAPIAEAQDRPKISLVLPSGIASETVQIDYFLTGPFGGYGGFVRAESNRASYDIEPFVDGRPAENIKIIAYLHGCEIAVLDLTFSGAPIEQWLDCYPVGSVSLRGQLSPATMTRTQSREIEVNYLAMWSHQFFGIADGPVTSIRLGTVRPDRDGRFEIALPDFYNQSSLRDGAIQFILRDAKTGNIIAFLKPAGTTLHSPNWLSVQAFYPIVQLVAEGQLRQPRP